MSMSDKEFKIGFDASSLIELESLGASFYDFDGQKKELFTLLKEHGFNATRIRLWLNPYTEEGEPYLGGTVDLNKALLLAKRAQELGLSIMLDIHYSDFWVDPGKQTLPKAWQNVQSLDELLIKVKEYTQATLLEFKKHYLNLEYIQIGNEVTNGMLWPFGKLTKNNGDLLDNFAALAAILNQGILASKEIYPTIKTIVHLENSGNTPLYDEFLSRLEKYHVPYDILGFSYYPYWHSTLANLEKTIALIKNKYHKEAMLVEYSFASSSHKIYDQELKELPLIIVEGKHKETNVVPYSYDLTGQQQFISDLYHLLRKYDVRGFYYWEPAWINVAGTSWSSLEAMDYIHEYKDFGNEWANQGLFSEGGLALDSLKIFQTFIKGGNEK